MFRVEGWRKIIKLDDNVSSNCVISQRLNDGKNFLHSILIQALLALKDLLFNF